MGNRSTNYVWDPQQGNIVEDCRKILELAKEYYKSNKILFLEQVGNNKAENYIRIIELLGRYGLYNIKFSDFPLNRFTPRAIYLTKNPRFACFWFFEFLNGRGGILRGDLEQLRKVVTLLSVIKPRGVDSIGLYKGSIICRCGGREYSLVTDLRGWNESALPSFSIMTKKSGLVKFYLVDAGVEFTGHQSKLNLQNLRNFGCVYGAKQYTYNQKAQRMLGMSSIRDTTLYFFPNRTADLISLSEFEEYQKKNAFDDPSKGFGTRLFFYNEANLIDTNLFPSGANTVRVLTRINNDDIALHNTPGNFIKTPIKECPERSSVLARVPRLLSIERSRLEQLVADHTIQILM